MRGALSSLDFRKLVGIRLVSQFSDGLFQASLVASVVFAPEQQDTAVGFLQATLIILLPYSILGPFTGVFIDRWRRRRILVGAPWVKAACAWLVLFDPIDRPVPFFAGALLALSVNRFFLSTAGAVVPRLVPAEDLLVANSLATVGGTVALPDRHLRRRQVADAVGRHDAGRDRRGRRLARRVVDRIADHERPLTRTCGPSDPSCSATSFGGSRSSSATESDRCSAHRRAIGPITSITLDQIGQGLLITISLVVFRERFGEGVASFSNLMGAGGVGVLARDPHGRRARGTPREADDRRGLVRGRGRSCSARRRSSPDWSVLLASFAVGLTFAWKKIPVDTMVQEAVPDGYRGRVFSVYDVVYNLARVVAAALAIPMIPRLGVGGLARRGGHRVPPLGAGRSPLVREGTRARRSASTRAVVPTRSRGRSSGAASRSPSTSSEPGTRSVTASAGSAFRLALPDGTELDVSRPEPDGPWRVDREADRPGAPPPATYGVRPRDAGAACERANQEERVDRRRDRAGVPLDRRRRADRALRRRRAGATTSPTPSTTPTQTPEPSETPEPTGRDARTLRLAVTEPGGRTPFRVRGERPPG